MREALEIMRRLLDGDKVTFDGEYYRTDRAKLYSPPLGPVPIWMAAGGPKSAALAAEMAQGIVTSVKDPAETMEKVIHPARAAAKEAGRPNPTILATRWTILADDDEQAWTALGAWRGLRAPGRLEAVDPADLRSRADDMPRQEILDKYTIVSSPEDIVESYRPLVSEVGADAVSINITGPDQTAIISMLGSEVLPALREAGS
jgi:coenzyme F420-dependent glucose-6-phosphate dehydrogenase